MSHILLDFNVRPSEFLLHFVQFLALFNRLLRVLVSSACIGYGLLQIRYRVFFRLDDFERLSDVLEAGFILLTELTQLCAFEEELQYLEKHGYGKP